MHTTLPQDDQFELDFDDDGLESGFTTIQNSFIVHFMPHANGNYIKVYLAGLARCFGNRSEQWTSARTLADEQKLSVDTVRRAWRYWEEVGLIRRIPRYIRDKRVIQDYRTEPTTEYCHQISSIIKFKRNIQSVIEQVSGGKQLCTPPLCTPAHPPYAAVHTIEEVQHEENQQDKTSGPVMSLLDVSNDLGASASEVAHSDDMHDVKCMERLVECFADIVNRKPTEAERLHLVRLVTLYGSDELNLALNELLVQRDLQRIHNPTRYLRGVLEKWQQEGPRRTDIVDHLKRLDAAK